MAVEIPSILLAWAKAVEDGAGGFTWRGENVQSITRNAAGNFSIIIQPQTIDPLRTVWEATSEVSGGEGTYCVLAYQAINQLDLSVYQDDGVVAPALVDPDGFSVRLTTFNVETPAVAVV